MTGVMILSMLHTWQYLSRVVMMKTTQGLVLWGLFGLLYTKVYVLAVTAPLLQLTDGVPQPVAIDWILLSTQDLLS